MSWCPQNSPTRAHHCAARSKSHPFARRDQVATRPGHAIEKARLAGQRHRCRLVEPAHAFLQFAVADEGSALEPEPEHLELRSPEGTTELDGARSQSTRFGCVFVQRNRNVPLVDRQPTVVDSGSRPARRLCARCSQPLATAGSPRNMRWSAARYAAIRAAEPLSPRSTYRRYARSRASNVSPSSSACCPTQPSLRVLLGSRLRPRTPRRLFLHPPSPRS